MQAVIHTNWGKANGPCVVVAIVVAVVPCAHFPTFWAVCHWEVTETAKVWPGTAVSEIFPPSET